MTVQSSKEKKKRGKGTNRFFGEKFLKRSGAALIGKEISF
jgi:hypothetical protein